MARVSRSSKDKDEEIYDILKSEHRAVKRNIKRMLMGERPVREIFPETVDALVLHMRGEEMVFYSRLANLAPTRAMAFRSIEEHNIVRQLINDINAGPTGDVLVAKVEVLNDMVSHHVRLEETRVFPRAKSVLTKDDAKAIAREYLNQKASPVQVIR